VRIFLPISQSDMWLIFQSFSTNSLRALRPGKLDLTSMSSICLWRGRQIANKGKTCQPRTRFLLLALDGFLEKRGQHKNLFYFLGKYLWHSCCALSLILIYRAGILVALVSKRWDLLKGSRCSMIYFMH